MSKIQPGHFVCFFVCLQFSDQRGREVIHPNVKPHDFSDSCDYHSYTLPKKKNTGFLIKSIICVLYPFTNASIVGKYSIEIYVKHYRVDEENLTADC